MDRPCLSIMLYIVKQQSYIDLKRTGIETLGDRKHFSWQSIRVVREPSPLFLNSESAPEI